MAAIFAILTSFYALPLRAESICKLADSTYLTSRSSIFRAVRDIRSRTTCKAVIGGGKEGLHPTKSGDLDISDTARSFIAPDSPKYDHMTKLVDRVLAKGGRVADGVRVQMTEIGRGLIAMRDFAKNEELFSTPLEHCFSIQNAPDAIKDFEEPFKALGYSDDYLLAFFLEYERHAHATEKRFEHYVSTLNAPPVPILASNEELDALNNTYCLRQIKMLKKAVKKSYERIFIDGVFQSYPGLFPKEKTTVESWATSLGIVWSRAFNLYRDANQDPSSLMWGLVPISDLINHDITAVNNYIQDYDVDPPSFILRTSKAVKKGEQFFITYGPHTSLQYFLFYGMVLLDNPYDYITLQIKHAGDAEDNDDLYVQIGSTGKVPLRFLAQAARIHYPDDPLGEGVTKMAAKIITGIDARNADWTTSIEEDMQRRQADHITFPAQMSMTLLINIKSLLRNMRSQLEDIISEPFSSEEAASALKGEPEDQSYSSYGLGIDWLVLKM